MLVLLDIDGTLLKTHGAGLAAMQATAEELHPGRTFSFDGISISGRLDSLIWRDLMASGGVDHARTDHGAFRARYGVHLGRVLDAAGRSQPLAGALALVERLAATEGIALGLLTGNYEHTGRLKVERAGFDLSAFEFNAWADDGDHRRDLPPKAMGRHAATRGPIEPADVIIVGDTPLDIDCARANGCHVVAVATGAHPREELAGHTPDLLLDDLRDTDSIALWMTSRKRPLADPAR